MISKIVLCFLGTLGMCDSMFYLYDKVHNRAIQYDFTDAGNIYYTSDNFHSANYSMKFNNFDNSIKTGNKISAILLKLRTKSLPNITLRHSHCNI